MLTRAPLDEAADELRFRRPRQANDFARFRKDLRGDAEVREHAGEVGGEVTVVDAGEEGMEI